MKVRGCSVAPIPFTLTLSPSGGERTKKASCRTACERGISLAMTQVKNVGVNSARVSRRATSDSVLLGEIVGGNTLATAQ
jgi:hypothetical protein